VKKILIASTNPGKTSEIKFGLQELTKQGIEILTLNDVVVGEDEPVENGQTFEENSFLKAKFYSDLTDLPAIADDGGLVIPYLNGEPGVRSRRWLGRAASDGELVVYTLKRLQDVARKNRSAHLEMSLCFYDPKTKKNVFETEKIFGHISETANEKRVAGFPYRAVFIVDKYNKFYDDLTEEEHAQVNHRLIALKRLTKKIEDLI
jgi:XTP/dITP diphosphohydrolase